MSYFGQAHLSGFSAASALTLTIKSISQFEGCETIRTLVKALKESFLVLGSSGRRLRGDEKAPNVDSLSSAAVNAEGVLKDVPRVALHMLPESTCDELVEKLSDYLRAVADVEWLCSSLGAVVRSISQKSEMSGRWSGERWWDEVTSER